MFSAILILLIMPFIDLSRSRGIQFKPLSKIAFYIFICNFLILMQLGAKHVESPFIELGQVSTIIYFSYFLIIVPFISLLENSLIELPSEKKNHAFIGYKSLIKSNLLSFSYILLGIFIFKEYINNIFDNCDTPKP
jgi:ubiquinol-cytochrome c reductase cytochrome b subunit